MATKVKYRLYEGPLDGKEVELADDNHVGITIPYQVEEVAAKWFESDEPVMSASFKEARYRFAGFRTLDGPIEQRLRWVP